MSILNYDQAKDYYLEAITKYKSRSSQLAFLTRSIKDESGKLDELTSVRNRQNKTGLSRFLYLGVYYTSIDLHIQDKIITFLKDLRAKIKDPNPENIQAIKTVSKELYLFYINNEPLYNKMKSAVPFYARKHHYGKLYQSKNSIGLYIFAKEIYEKYLFHIDALFLEHLEIKVSLDHILKDLSSRILDDIRELIPEHLETEFPVYYIPYNRYLQEWMNKEEGSWLDFKRAPDHVYSILSRHQIKGSKEAGIVLHSGAYHLTWENDEIVGGKATKKYIKTQITKIKSIFKINK